jgi:hypothetical protein
MRILVEDDDADDEGREEALCSADDLDLDLLLLPAVGGTHSPVDASDPAVVESLLCSAIIIIIPWVRVVVVAAALDDNNEGRRTWKAKASTPPFEDAAAAKNPASAIRSFMVVRCPYFQVGMLEEEEEEEEDGTA